MLPVSILLIGCSEFSETEEEVIRSGRLYNEAIAAEFHDTFVDYWNNTVSGNLDKAVEDYNDEAMENISNTYMFFGDNLLSDMYVDEQEKKAKALEYISDSFREFYEKTINLLKSQIGTKGLTATAQSLNEILESIEKGENEWIFNEDETSLPAQLGLIIAHPKYGFGPENVSNVYEYKFENVPWQFYYMNSANKGSSDDCVYAALKLMQQWMNAEQGKDISVVYCAPYEDSFNSYLVGYSNHRSFLITFLRNDDKKCSYEWQEMEYESSYVGNTLLD